MANEQPQAERFYPAALEPAAWQVVCPTCGAAIEVDNVEQDDCGAYRADGLDQFPKCSECGTLIEVRAVSVQEAYPETAP